MNRNQLYSTHIDVIRTNLGSESEKELFESALLKWKESKDIMHFRGFLMDMRALTEEILERVAPTDAIHASIWYEDSADNEGVTREQRLKYILQKAYPEQLLRHTEMDFDNLSEPIHLMEKELAKWDLFYFQHLPERSTKNIDRNVGDVLLIFINLLNQINFYFPKTDAHMADWIMVQLAKEILDEYDDESDFLPDHAYTVSDYDIEDTEIIRFSSRDITVKVTGSIKMAIDAGPLLLEEDPPLAGTQYDFPFYIMIQFPLDPDEEEEPFRIEDFQLEIQARKLVVN